MRLATHHPAWPRLFSPTPGAALSSPAPYLAVQAASSGPGLDAVAAVPDLPAIDLEARAALAANLINLGNQLSDQGRHGEALAATEEGVAMFRALADEGPAFRAPLAWSLHSLARRHLALDRPGDGLAPAQEAVAILREEAQSNPLYQRQWASAVHTLSRVRSGLRIPPLKRSRSFATWREATRNCGENTPTP